MVVAHYQMQVLPEVLPDKVCMEELVPLELKPTPIIVAAVEFDPIP